ncbi:MAG: ATP-binding protein [Candidatus Jorgensenbacteria bacterium]
MIQNVFRYIKVALGNKRGVGYAALSLGGVVIGVVGIFVWNPALSVLTALLSLSLGGGLLYTIGAAEGGAMTVARSERELNSLAESVHEGVVTYSPDFVILGLNQAAERLFGIPAKEVVGKRMDPSLTKDVRLASLVQTLFPSLAPRMTQLSEAGVWPQENTVGLINPPRELSTSTLQLTDAQGKVVAFLKLIKDLTQEEALVSSKNEFVGVAAHQLRTPLTAIRWSLEALEKATEGSTPEIRQLIRETRDLAERALKTANDLLDVTKIEEGKLEFRPTDVDFVALMRKILQTVAPIAKQHEVTVYLNPPETPLPPLRLDESRIAAAVMNLLDNAIRYNVRGGKVAVSLVAVTAPPALKVTIEDTGVGIPKGELGKLFGKLQRGSNAAQIEPNGSGLGLYITKSVIKNHGGDIGIASELNRGTTIWFTLPISH